MGTALITMQVMPSSPEEDLEKLQEDIKDVIETNDGKNVRFEQEAVAFGLKAVNASFEIPEDKSMDVIEEGLNNLERSNSAKVTDMRRALE